MLYLEVNSSPLILIKQAKKLLNKESCITRGKQEWVSLQYFLFVQLTIWTFFIETPEWKTFYSLLKWVIAPVDVYELDHPSFCKVFAPQPACI